MSFRLAAYAVCIQDADVLLVRAVSGPWTLPGGGVEIGEDPYDTVLRELTEETGHTGAVERLLGVDSRVIPAAEAVGGELHQNVGVYYTVRVVGGRLRHETGGSTDRAEWTPLAAVTRLRRSSLVDVGIALAQSRPADGRVPPVPVGGLVVH